jgi:hypothetical protein
MGKGQTYNITKSVCRLRRRTLLIRLGRRRPVAQVEGRCAHARVALGPVGLQLHCLPAGAAHSMVEVPQQEQNHWPESEVRRWQKSTTL